MTEGLKACPFCGSEGKIFRDIDRFSVGCENDECRGFIGLSWLYTSEEAAVKAWNTRPQGRWLRYDEEEANAWECSVCHNVWQLMDGNPTENGMEYCQRCGAEMTLDDTEASNATD